MKTAYKLFGVVVIFFVMSFKLTGDKKVIVIDAGHGGEDFGFINGAAYEKEIVGNISEKIKVFNKKENIEIIVIGDKDSITSIPSRVARINQLHPDLVISLHVSNSTDKAANGVQAFISEKNPNYEKSFKHAEELVQVVAKKDLKITEVKKANLLLLENSQSPAVSLELGYLSNEQDREYLMSEKGQTKIAKRIIAYLDK